MLILRSVWSTGVDTVYGLLSDEALDCIQSIVYILHVCSQIIIRDQPNSREKMHDFTAEFLKCVKFHGKFTERVSEIHGPRRRYFEVLC